MRVAMKHGPKASTLALVALIALVGVPARAQAQEADDAPAASASVTVDHPEPKATILRGVVGRAVYVALPTIKGYAWEWAARGDRWLFDSPFKVRFMSEPRATEIWTFPLARAGRILLDFTQRPVSGPMGQGTATHSVKLWVMTPYEAQQHAPAELRDTLLLR